jgi:hypothetical protein
MADPKIIHISHEGTDSVPVPQTSHTTNPYPVVMQEAASEGHAGRERFARNFA